MIRAKLRLGCHSYVTDYRPYPSLVGPSLVELSGLVSGRSFSDFASIQFHSYLPTSLPLNCLKQSKLNLTSCYYLISMCNLDLPLLHGSPTIRREFEEGKRENNEEEVSFGEKTFVQFFRKWGKMGKISMSRGY